MKGTPYFGEKTAQQLEVLRLRKPESLTPTTFKGVTDIYTLFRYLACEGYLFVIEDETGFYTSWAWDIRFNYRDREIFIPYYTYETFLHKALERDLSNPYLTIVNGGDSGAYIEVKHSFKMGKLIIDDRKTGYRVPSVTVYNPQTEDYYKILLIDLQYFSLPNFSITDLLSRHTNYKYNLMQFDDLSKADCYLDPKVKFSRERSIRNSKGYPTYVKPFLDINYQDIRTYNVGAFSEEATLVISSDPYHLRVYDFEAYLYCIFAQGVEPIESEYLDIWNSLGVSKRFITLGGKHPLTLKYYYTDKPQKFKKLTYERFKQGITE